MAAPVWQSSTAVASTNGTSCIYTLPGSIAVNDIVTLTLYKENTAAITWPSGFTQVTTVALAGANMQQAWAWKRMAGGESGTVTASWTGSVFRCGQASRITGGVTSGDPFGTNFTTVVNETASTTCPAISLASTPADSLLLWGVNDFAGTTTAWTPPTGFTLCVPNNTASTDVMMTAWKTNAAGGATGSLTGSVNIGSDKMTAFLGALSSPAAATSKPNRRILSQAVHRSSNY
jgi:hypothetical protein